MARKRGFGSVYRRRRGDGTLIDGWYVRWTDTQGRRFQRYGGTTREQADAFLATKQLEKARARLLGVRTPEEATLQQLLPRIRAEWETRLRPQTVKDLMYRVRYFADLLAEKPLRAVTREDVQGIVTRLKVDRGLEASTVRHYVQVLSGIFSVAAELGAAGENPCRGLKLPRVEEKPVPYFTAEDLRSIEAAMPEQIRPAVALIIETGLRRGEVLALRWDDVTPDFARITVARSKNYRPRVVPLSARAAGILRDLVRHRRVDGDGRVFRIWKSKFADLFRKAADAAGYPAVTPHKLRHAFGSGLAQAGVPLTTVKELLGHQSITQTQRYAAWVPENAGVLAIRALEESRGQGTALRRKSRSSSRRR